MKFLFRTLLLCLLSSVSYAQTVYQIRADSVRIYSACDTAELIIENHTQDTLGVLFNKGKGRTEFRKMRMKLLGNSLAIVGQDTIQLGTLVKTAVDTLYRSNDSLYYRKMDGTTLAVKLDLSSWGDSRYDLSSTNFRTIAYDDSVLYNNWTAGKIIGYDAYRGADMPALSDQAFQGKGNKIYYNGFALRSAIRPTGFDFAINWDGELLGPNGAFIRTKDDTRQEWSAWRELLFKDYGDKAYIRNQNAIAQSAGSWVTGVMRTEGRFSLLKPGSDGLAASIVLEDPAGSKAANIQLTANNADGYPGLAFWGYDAIGWKETMRITPGGLVGLGVTNPRSKMDITGGGIRTSEYIHLPFANSSNGGVNQLWNSFEGRQLFADPEFRTGLNSTSVYNNLGGNAVTMTRTNTVLSNAVPNSSGYYLKIDYKTGLPSSPGLGGFVAGINTTANKTHITRIRALIPVGYSIQQASNAHGSSWIDRWLSKTEGTGKWEDYIFRWGSGDGGTFSSVNYFWLTGPTDTDITWYVAYFDSKDVTSSSWVDNVTTNAATARPLKLSFNTDSTELSQGTQNTLRIKLPNGYTEIGALNTDYSYFQTDRAKFYFSKPVLSLNGSGIVGSDKGKANMAVLSFYENDAKTRVGYIGKSASGNTDMYLTSDSGNITLVPNTVANFTNFLTVKPAEFFYNGGLVNLSNTTSNNILFGNGLNAPTFNTRSVGTKITLNPVMSGSQGDYSLGVESSNMWLAVPQNNATNGFKFYGGITEVGRIDGAGNSFWSGRGTFNNLVTTTISSNNSISDVSIFGGADGTISSRGAEIKLRGGTNAISPGEMTFHTGIAQGGTTQPERLRITATGNVGIATNAPTSTLQVNGSVAKTIKIITSNTTLTDADYTVLADASSSTNISVTLPDATTCVGRIYNIKLLGTGTSGGMTIKPATGQKLDNATTFVSNVAYLGVTIQAAGGNWYIISKSQP
ncbi:hypothetical protein [Chitinophaga sp. RAB17]|uniref:hypothetical protein n=1 Tax=Chitinophaga sp. RAB17 TaxID=3233049 RepID=UPI003F8E90E7